MTLAFVVGWCHSALSASLLLPEPIQSLSTEPILSRLCNLGTTWGHISYSMDIPIYSHKITKTKGRASQFAQGSIEA